MCRWENTSWHRAACSGFLHLLRSGFHPRPLGWTASKQTTRRALSRSTVQLLSSLSSPARLSVISLHHSPPHCAMLFFFLPWPMRPSHPEISLSHVPTIHCTCVSVSAGKLEWKHRSCHPSITPSSSASSHYPRKGPPHRGGHRGQGESLRWKPQHGKTQLIQCCLTLRGQILFSQGLCCQAECDTFFLKERQLRSGDFNTFKVPQKATFFLNKMVKWLHKMPNCEEETWSVPIKCNAA